MTKSTLERLIELEKAATSAPWVYSCGERPSNTLYWNICENGLQSIYTTEKGNGSNEQNLTLIAESRNHLPALLDVAKYTHEYFCERTSDERGLELEGLIIEALQKLEGKDE